jgi:hypothetical protein
MESEINEMKMKFYFLMMLTEIFFDFLLGGLLQLEIFNLLTHLL